MLEEFSTCASLSLQQRQQIAGRMQRAALEMPPGAQCLIANTFTMMTGMTLPWQRRRTTKVERDNYRFFCDLMMFNVGTAFLCAAVNSRSVLLTARLCSPRSFEEERPS